MSALQKTLQFMDGAGGDDEIALLLAGDLQAGNYDFTRIFTLDSDDQWGHWDFDSVVVSIAMICQKIPPQRQYFGLGRNGEIFCAESGKHPWNEVIATAGTGKKKRGVLKRIRLIGNHMYLCGAGGQVYRRNGYSSWTALDTPPLTSPAPSSGILADIGGFSETDIYALGEGGRIFHYDGSLWRDISPPTNLYLESLRCAADGKVYVCGQKGTLLAGDKDGWHSLLEPNDIEDIWDIQPFQNTLYVAADDRLMKLCEGELVAVETGLSPAPEAFRFSVSNGVLWSIGESDIARFDGITWQRVLHPDNQP